MPDQLTLNSASLVETLAETLESMAFVSLMPAEPPYNIPADAVRIRIGFRGPSRGVVEMIAPRDLGRLLVANISCDEAPETCSVTQADDALKEIINIVSGALLRQHGTSENYDISLPTASPLVADSEWVEFVGSSDVTVVDAEGASVAVRIDVVA